MLLAGLTYGCIAQGGFYRNQFVPFAVVSSAAVLPLAVAGVGGMARRLLPVVGLAALAASAVLLGAWRAGVPHRVSATIVSIVLVALALAVGATVPRVARPVALAGLLLLGSGIAATAWWGAVGRRFPWGLEADGLWRGSSTLSYANATASVLVPLALAATAWLAAHRRQGATRRDPAVLGLQAVLFVLLTGAGTTQSRAGAIALVAGLVVLAVRHRRWLTVMAPAAFGAVVASAVALSTVATSRPAEPGTALAGLAAGVLITTVLAVADRRVGGAALVVGLVAVAAFAVRADLDDLVRSRLTLSSTRQGGVPEATYLLGDRWPEWTAAAENLQREPLTGVGPGNLDLSWVAESGQAVRAIYVHNEYLEWAATYGVVGLVTLLAALGAVVRSVFRRHRDLDPCLTGVGAAALAFALHTGLDFLWHQPAIPVLMALLVGLRWLPPPDDVDQRLAAFARVRDADTAPDSTSSGSSGARNRPV